MIVILHINVVICCFEAADDSARQVGYSYLKTAVRGDSEGRDRSRCLRHFT